MFWSDDEVVKKRHARIRMQPPIPDLGYVIPKEFPNLSAATVIGFDTETKDPKLIDEGPGWARGKGHIVGVSLAARDRLGNRGSWYFPVRHEVEPQDNLDPANVFPFVKSVLETNVDKIGANTTYDIGWLGEENIEVKGKVKDIQFAEALIDNEALVALDVVSRKYLGYGKQTDHLFDWCREAYPNTPIDKWRADIYRAPPKLVGFYAEGDALQPIDIHEKQEAILAREGLEYVYALECGLIPLMIKMRREGVTVDVAKAEKLVVELRGEIQILYAQIYHEYGFNLQSTSTGDLSRLFDYVGISYPRTANGNASIVKEWLAALQHPLGVLLNDIREREKIISTFLIGYIIEKNINGKLFPQFHQLHSDDSGTKVGRFSSSDPNLQNIPSRTKLGKRVRECFIPDPGHARWIKFDYSQVHYRILAHNAVGPGSDELRQRYNDDPNTDYHMDVYSRAAPLLGWSLTDPEIIKEKRRPVKNFNFGLLYGQSVASLKFKSGMSGQDAENFVNVYFQAAPYVKPTMEAIEAEMQSCGYVTTLLGRRVRFYEFEPARRRQKGEVIVPLPYKQALAEWGAPLKYAYGYRAVNYKFQGSEPDIMKKGMYDCYKSGVYDYLGVPRLTVHDENDLSLREDTPAAREALAFVKNTMENTLKLRVPLKVDMSEGPNWGKAD